MKKVSKQHMDIFENLFVLELANNHLGSVERGLRIIKDHASIVRKNGVKAAIKLQFRDVAEFIHPSYKGNETLRYVRKTEATRLSKEDFATLVNEIRIQSCIPMATPFDEVSVDLCVHFDMPIIKIASSDIDDWPLIEKITSTRRPVIASTGGASEETLDALVSHFEQLEIPLALNHCVSLYPSEDRDLDLDQIDYLRKRYPEHIIGLSTHEYNDWHSSMLISYAKGARTWERHIDIKYNQVPVSAYCSVPGQCDQWFQAYHKAREMCGNSGSVRRTIPKEETDYLDQLVRGAYARRNLEPNYVLNKESFEQDFYLAIPLLKGQLSCREVIHGVRLQNGISANEPLMVGHIEGLCGRDSDLKEKILKRGL